ncbi:MULTISPECIES: hypothetical protein [Hafnia]|uniref:hypothetical protein n=1 Tax=Hafnia TaxID=568 RepID=UPI0008A627F8|nr:hypothetical protein [Hafnia sp. HMSC23F03]OFS08841.1 hypothetical protein HMPREF3091_16990 [Hafnia sp. HMSC23F03]
MSGNHSTVEDRKALCFDYTRFLSASCNKHWGFIDAIYGVMPLFGMVTRSQSKSIENLNAQIRQLAMQVLSTQVSDETNIVRLIELVKNQGLQELDIQLPYALEDEQLMTIQAECRNAVSMTQYDERLHVVITTTKEPKRK